MAEQDKDLPLVVAEILIEMHGLNNRAERLGDQVEQLGDRVERVEDTLLQVAGSVQQLSSAVTRMAEVINKQQEVTTNNFKLLMAADERNTTRLENALQQINQGFASLENRFERLENR